jgi:hypothetical protein
MIAAVLLVFFGAYLLCGFLFALPFAFLGVRRIDPHAAHGFWGFRLLIIPGAMALWPILLRRWATGVHEPPEECTAHRTCSHLGQSGSDRDEVDSSRITYHASGL